MRTLLPHPGFVLGLFLGLVVANLVVSGQADLARAAVVAILASVIMFVFKAISHGIKHRND